MDTGELIKIIASYGVPSALLIFLIYSITGALIENIRTQTKILTDLHEASEQSQKQMDRIEDKISRIKIN